MTSPSESTTPKLCLRCFVKAPPGEYQTVSEKRCKSPLHSEPDIVPNYREVKK